MPLLLLAQALGIFVVDRMGMPASRILFGGAVLIALYWFLPRSGLSRVLVALAIAFSLGAYSLALRLTPSTSGLQDFSEDGVVEATVCEDPTRSELSISVLLCSVHRLPGPGLVKHFVAGDQGRRSDILLRAYAGDDEYAPLLQLEAGQRIRAYLRLREVEAARNPGGQDARVRARRRGLGLKARLLDPSLLVRLREGERAVRKGGSALEWPRALSRLRRRSADKLMEPTSSDGGSQEVSTLGGALLAALAVGERSGLTRPVKDAFVVLGLSHLLAVSGLHLVLIGGVAYRLILQISTCLLGRRPYRDRRPLAVGCAVGLAGAYAVWAGFGIPVQRAWILLLVLVPIMWRKRKPPLAWGLVWAGVWVLSFHPAALFELGAQLSFAATGGLLLAARGGVNDVVSGLPRAVGWLGRGVWVSMVAIAFTAPFLAQVGLPVSGAGLVMNLVAIPWMALVLLPAALFSSVVVALDLPAMFFLVSLAQELAGWTIVACLELAALWPRPLGVGPVSWVGVFVAGGLALLMALESHPLRAGVLFVCALLWLVGSSPVLLDPPPPRVVMFDVGQGDAVLLQGRRAAVLVDAGRSFMGGGDMGRSVVAPGLRALGVSRLDALVASHADLDHRGGLLHILTQFEVGEIWLPAAAPGREGFGALRALAKSRGVPVLELAAGDPIREVGDIVFEPLWPPPVLIDDSTNENSLVLRAEMAGYRILLTGDIGSRSERALMDRGARLAADLLKVAHHGSAGSSTASFLHAVDARISLVSASCAGFSGLPSPHTLKRLEASGTVVGWTGRDGAILVGLGSKPNTIDGLGLRTWAESRACPVGEG